MRVVVICEPGRRGEAAIAQAHELVRGGNAQLTLAAVLDLPTSHGGCLPWSTWRELVVAEARAELDRIAARLKPDAERIVIVGRDAAQARLQALECDVLILPARPGWPARDPYATIRDDQRSSAPMSRTAPIVPRTVPVTFERPPARGR